VDCYQACWQESAHKMTEGVKSVKLLSNKRWNGRKSCKNCFVTTTKRDLKALLMKPTILTPIKKNPKPAPGPSEIVGNVLMMQK
jgi:hypothetical protein